MKKVKNCLYITKQGVYLSKEHDVVVVSVKNDKGGYITLLKMPLLAISHIYCYGNVMVSPFLMGHCAKLGTMISFFDELGRYLSSVVGPQKGNILLRLQQYDYFKDPKRSLDIVKNIVVAKISSSRNLILRHLRNHGESETLVNSVNDLKLMINYVRGSDAIDMVRGYEGKAGQIYFAAFSGMIRNRGFIFSGRVRRPPKDPINALLSYFYSILVSETAGALYSVGLDAQLGFLHRPRSGRCSLALDLIEEFRVPVVDRFVLSLINREQVGPSDFCYDLVGGCSLKDDARKKVLGLWQDRRTEVINHPYTGDDIYRGLLPAVQANLLAAYLRGDLETYPAYAMR